MKTSFQARIAGMKRLLLGAMLVMGVGVQVDAMPVYALKTQTGVINTVLLEIPLDNASPPALPTGTSIKRNAIQFLYQAVTKTTVYTDGLAIVGSGPDRGTLYAFVHPKMTASGFGSATPATAGAVLVTLDKAVPNANAVTAKPVSAALDGNLRADAIITGAAFDTLGNLWVLNHYLGTLERIAIADSGTTLAGHVLESHRLFTMDAGVRSEIPENGSYPEGTYLGDLAIDADNKALISGYTGSTGADRVRQLNLNTGEITASASALPSQQIGGLGFYRDQQILAINASGTDKLVYAEAFKNNFAAADWKTTIANLSSTSSTVNSGAVDLASIPNKITADPDSAAVMQGTSVVIAVLDNDKNVQSEAMAVTAIVAAPTQGTVSIAADGQSITYSANADASPTDSLVYRVCTKESEICTTATVSLTITPMPVVSLTCSPTSLNDSAGQSSICNVTSDQVAPTGGLPLDITLPAPLATVRYDVSECTALQSIAAGNSSATCQVHAIANDNPWDGDTSLSLALGAYTTGAIPYRLGSQTSEQIAVVNDDLPPTVSIACPSPIVDAAGAAGVSQCVVTSTYPAPSGGLPVVLQSSTHPTRYTSSCTGALIPAGNTTTACQVVATDNTVPWDGDVTATVQVMAATGGLAYAPSSTVASVLVKDDDSATVSMSCTPAVIKDSAGEQSTCTITSTAAAPVGGLPVNLQASTDARYDATDCTGTKTIAAGAKTASCVVKAVENTVAWDGNKTATISVAAASAGSPAYTPGAAPATVEVQDDDSATVSVSCAPAVIKDSTGEQSTCTVTSSNAAPVGGVPVSLQITDIVIAAKQAAATATKAGGQSRYDASACAQPLVIPAGATTAGCLVLAEPNDVPGDGAVEISLQVLSSATGAATPFTASPTVAKVTVEDDDLTTVVPAAVQPVPTLGELALAFLTLLLLALGMRTARRASLR